MTFTTDRSILPFLLIVTIFSNLVPIPVYAQYGKVEPNSKLDHVVLQLPYYHMFNYAGFYAAQEKGFYREEGLVVEILEGSPEFTPTEKILAGEATFGIQNDDLLLEYLAGKDVIVLAVLFQHSPWALMVNAESDYESPQDLAGSKIALELNSRDAAILAMLKQEGVSIDAVTKVRASWDVFHIFDGSIDARLVYLNDPEFVNLSKEGKRFRLIKPINYGIDFYGDSLFTSTEQIRRDPGRVAAFRQATLKGWNYALDNPDEIIDVILEKQGVMERGLTRELFQFEAAETRKLMSYPLVEVGHMNRHRWEKMAETYVSLDMTKPNYSLEGFIYDPDPSSNYVWVRWLAVVCGGTLLCLVGVIIWNRQLQRRVALKTRQYQESEEKYRVVAETATDGIISIDRNSTILYANPALGKIFGYHADDLIGKSLTTLMPSDLRDKHLRSIGQFIVTGQKQTSWNGIELKGMRSDNRTIPIEVSFGVIKEKPDRFIFTGIIRDITERKKAQDALSESERALSTLMSNLQGMAYRCRNNEDWTMEFVSQGSLELTGYAPSDLVNNQKISFVNLMIPEERKPIWDQVQEALSNREAYEFTFRIKTSQGTEKWVWERGRGVFSEQGDVIALEGFITDISARIQAEKKLRHAHDELELRVRERTQELSKALENLKMAQYELVHVEKMAALGHLVAGVAHEINTPLGAIRSSNKNTLAALDSSMHHLPKLFEVLPAELQRDFFLLLDRDARVNHILTTKEKRKEKKNLTRQLLDAGVERSDSVADTLVDIGISGNIESLIDLLKNKHQEMIVQTAYDLARLRDSNENIKIAVDRAAKIVFALKTYAHADHTNVKVKTNIVSGIETVLVLYQNQLKHGVELIKEYQDIPDLACYPDELNQVWTNLIYNALQAMEYKGTLKIKTGLKDDLISVSFTDSGKGIPPEIRPRIFDPFFTTKAPGEGCGLGLDICKRIIDKHGGTIEFESEPGKTTFTVTLPNGS